MKTLQLLAFLGVFAFSAAGQSRQTPRATSSYTSSIDGVIGQFVDGGAWKTTLTLINVDSTPCTYTIKFYSDTGVLSQVQTTDGTSSTLTGNIPVGGFHRFETLDIRPDTQTTWALVTTSNETSGIATFRQRIPGRNDFEASVPIETYLDSNKFLFAFDHPNSATGIGIVNATPFKETIFLQFRDEQGNQFDLETFDLGPLGHTAFDLATKYPATATRRGVVTISTTGFGIVIVPLRFIDGAFSSIFPLAPL